MHQKTSTVPLESPHRSERHGQEADFSALVVDRATPDDAETIAYISALVNVGSYAQFDRGFLLFSFSAEEHAARLGNGYVGYIFRLSGRPIGFASGVRRARILADSLSYEVHPTLYSTVEHYAQGMQLSDYMVLHQLAIVPGEQNKGYGEIFVTKLSRIERGPFFSLMLEAPLRNPRIRYWAQRGNRKLGELREKPSSLYLSMEPGASPVEELTWGLYMLDDGGWIPLRTDPNAV